MIVMPSTPYRIAYARAALEHMGAIARRLHGLIRETIEQQLADEPLRETKNRKPVRDPNRFGPNTWELRFGPGNSLRVFYEADEQQRSVYVKGIGQKEGSVLRIGGEEVTL
jgi:hypothetical protein